MDIPRVIRERAEHYAERVKSDISALAEDPFGKSQWADGFFDHAALAYVFDKVATALEKPTEKAADVRIAELVEQATRKAMMTSRPRFSSTCANLSDLCEKAAWAEVIDYLRGWK